MRKLLHDSIQQLQSYEISNIEKLAKTCTLTWRVFEETVTYVHTDSYTHTYTHRHIDTHIRTLLTKSISRYLVRVGLWPVRVWFKNIHCSLIWFYPVTQRQNETFDPDVGLIQPCFNVGSYQDIIHDFPHWQESSYTATIVREIFVRDNLVIEIIHCAIFSWVSWSHKNILPLNFCLNWIISTHVT